ncbi:flavodoxin family protein [Zongyangia hominis]|uniref:Flavodoxin family protein n=1 Tax=Zongyangia hominis TaxID=2763677 RepID=A0A926ED30_9FIRM|nr:NAD(P)H-dependent oxidoreductase [Zongyangia hominis]MBC8570850.1 flavodoxin family protein [Zongyangia hominis]
MKITVLYGNNRKGSTYHSVQAVLSRIQGEKQVEEFFLPRDMPHFCLGCFNCIKKGEEFCPHAEDAGPIIRSLEEADLIVLSSPVYVYDVSGSLKAMLDHVAYHWLIHRPHPPMFQKVALCVSTTAGGGLKSTLGTMKHSLRFWGVPKIYTLGTVVHASRWEDVSEKTKAKIEKRAEGLARSIGRSVESGRNPSPSPYKRGMLFLAKKLQQAERPMSQRDAAYWKANGWLDGQKPWKTAK